MEAIAAALRTRPELKVVGFADCFTRRKEGVIFASLKALGAAFAELSLDEIDLSDNAVSRDGACIFQPYLAQCSSLTTLRLNNTGVGPVGGEAIGKALVQGAANGSVCHYPRMTPPLQLIDPGA